MTQTNPELDGLEGTPPETITLSNGAVAKILDLKTRQLFRLLRIVTHGAGGFLLSADLNLNDSAESFVAKLIGILIIAVPESEDETIAFLSSMVAPDGLIERPGRDKGAEERNTELWARLNEAMLNPEMEDTFALLEAILQREAKDIMSLGKRLAGMLTLFQKVPGLSKPLSESSTPESAQSALTDSLIPTVLSEALPTLST